MALTQEERDTIKVWIDNAADERFARGSRLSVAEQKAQGLLFSVKDKDVPFLTGLAAYKYMASQGTYDYNTLSRDMITLRRTPISARDYHYQCGKVNTQMNRGQFLLCLYAALIEAECGFPTLEEHEYEALKVPIASRKFGPKLLAATIFDEKPTAELRKCSFETFKALVTEVMAERGIAPLALVPEVATTDTPATVAVSPGAQVSEAKVDGFMQIETQLQAAVREEAKTQQAVVAQQTQLLQAQRQHEAAQSKVTALANQLGQAQRSR